MVQNPFSSNSVTCINYQLIQDWTAINEYLLLGTQHSAHHVVRFTAYLESKWFFNPQRWRIARCSDRKVFVIAVCVCVCVCHPCHFAFRWRVPQPNQQDHIFAKHSDPIGTRQKFRSHEILQIWNDKKSILPHDLISLLSRKSSLKCAKSMSKHLFTCCSASSESKSAKSKKFSSQNDHFEDLFLAIFMCQRLHNLIFWESSKECHPTSSCPNSQSLGLHPSSPSVTQSAGSTALRCRCRQRAQARDLSNQPKLDEISNKTITQEIHASCVL